MPTLTFADHPLLLPDPEGELQDWLDKLLAAEDMRWWGDPLATHSNRLNPLSRQVASCEMGRYNWPAPPPPRLNTLWVPTGATRWSVGLFLAPYETIQALSGTQSGTLKMGDLSFTLCPLTPRPLTAYEGDDGKKQVYLLPLVDRRYWWQFIGMGDFTLTPGTTTWADVLTQIGTQIGMTLAPPATVDSGYGFPDPVELDRLHENCAAVLDATAASIGLRVVYDPAADTVALHSAASCRSDLLANVATSRKPLYAAGGDTTSLHGAIPAAVRVVFPRYQNQHPQINGAIYSRTKGPTGVTATQPAGSEFVIFDTAQADYTVSTSSTPDNDSTLSSLVDLIAASYYDWRKEGTYDLTLRGIAPWTLTGHDNWVLYAWGHQPTGGADNTSHEHRDAGQDTDPILRDDYLCSPGGYLCTTRVQCMPPNVDMPTMLHQFKTGGPSDNSYPPHPWSNLRRYELKTINSDGTADAYLLEWDADNSKYDVLDTDHFFVLHNPAGKVKGAVRDAGPPVKQGDRGVAWGPVDDTRWEQIAPAKRGMYRGSVYTVTVAKSDGTFEVDTTHPVDGGPSITDDEPITVQNWAMWEASSGMPVLFVWDSEEDEYLFVQGPCKADWS